MAAARPRAISTAGRPRLAIYCRAGDRQRNRNTMNRRENPVVPKNAQAKKTGRRRFLLGGLLAGGAMLVGWGVQPPRQRLHASRPLALGGGTVGLNGWIAIAPDGAVSVVVPRSEMGQGVHTAL